MGQKNLQMGENDNPPATKKANPFCESCEVQRKKIEETESRLRDWMGSQEYQAFKSDDKNLFDTILDIVKYAWGPKV